MMKSIRFAQVSKQFPGNARLAVDKVSLTVEAGALVVLLGPSGCGKTTLLKMVNRLYEPTSGEIFLDNSLIPDPASLASDAIVPENDSVTIVVHVTRASVCCSDCGQTTNRRIAGTGNFDAGTLRVAVALQRRKGSKTLVEPKTFQSRRTLPLPSVLLTALKAHRTRQIEERLAAGPRWQDHGLVFPSTVGTPIEPRNLTRQFKDVLKRAELPEATRFHDLRHTAASLLVAQGVHPRVVMEILGHSQISLTMNTYAHVLPEAQREAIGKMGSLLSMPTPAVN